MFLTKEEFQGWMQDKVTQKIWTILQEKINQDKVAYTAYMGVDQLKDRYNAGMFRAWDAFLSMEDLFDFGEGER